MPTLDGLDHFVLTARDPDATVTFYTTVLGMTLDAFSAADGTVRRALIFGRQKINIHHAAGPFQPHADAPVPGALDFCLITTDPLADWTDHLDRLGIPIEEGPIGRTGARGPITSIYLRDPDGNLIEIARYDG